MSEVMSNLKKDSIFQGMPWLVRRNILKAVEQTDFSELIGQNLGRILFNEDKCTLIGYSKWRMWHCEYSISPSAFSKQIAIEVRKI